MSKAASKKKLPTVSRLRLVELILALQSGAELDDASRAEIVDALGWLFGMKLIEERQRTRGRQRNDFQHTAAHYVHALVEQKAAVGDYAGALTDLATLKPSVDKFFDDVLVMDKDETVKQNRLALLGTVNALFRQIADFRQLQV